MTDLLGAVIRWKDDPTLTPNRVYVAINPDPAEDDPEDEKIFFYFSDREELADAILHGTEDFYIELDQE